MAINNAKVLYSPNGPLPVATYDVAASATLIYPGEFVKQTTAGAVCVIKLADAEPVIGTTPAVMGLAASTSTNTSVLAGKVQVYKALPGVVYELKAKAGTAVDTQAELDALIGKQCLIDLTGTTFTIDETTATGATYGFQIVGGDIVKKTVHVILRNAAADGPVA